ncbi:MAG: hypothetical protein RJA70_4520 [Pseudomonadota bacterium]|jgi:CheY-like chemotaxis protein
MTVRYNLLVIDDDEIMLQVIDDLLTEHGYRVVTMGSPIGATQTILKESIHLVVVDWRMPVMQGDRLATLLRSWERVRDIPVILISGSCRESLEEVAKTLTDVSVVTKALMSQELPAAVIAALKIGHAGSDVKRRAASFTPSRTDVESFATRLAKRIHEAADLWRSVVRGEGRHFELDFLVDTIHGQAQLLGLADMARLMEAIHAITHKVAEGKAVPTGAADVVSRALKVAATMPALQGEGSAALAAPFLEKLNEASRTLGR